MTERTYFRREYASRYYGWLPFALSAIFIEVPYILFYTTCFMGAFYWTAGLVNTYQACGYFYLMLNFFILWAVAFGFVIAALSESELFAATLIPVILATLILFSGLMQPPSAMPHFWESWMYWLDPFHYYIEGLLVNELASLPVVCNNVDYITFTPPPGQTCGEYTADFFAFGAPGYIENATATDICKYCSFSSGKEFYTQSFQWDEAHKLRNLGIIIGFYVFNVLLFLVLCFFKKKGKR